MSRLSQFLPGSSQGASGVALSGEAIVLEGSTYTYTITNYNSFSYYEVISSVGTVTRTGDSIELVLPFGLTETAIDLIVTKDGVDFAFALSLSTVYIATPTVTINEGTTGVGSTASLSATAFDVTPDGADSHVSTDWQVSTDSTFSTLVWNLAESTTALTETPIGLDLTTSTTYYVRARYHGATLAPSAWSPTVQFTTAASFLADPILSGPSSANESEVVTVLITNFDASVAYTINVTKGTFTRVDGAITWTLPSTNVDTSATLDIFATKDTDVTNVVTHTITIYRILVEDTAVQVTNYEAIEDTSTGFIYV